MGRQAGSLLKGQTGSLLNRADPTPYSEVNLLAPPRKPVNRRKVTHREGGAKSGWILFPAKPPALAIARSEYTTGLS